MVVESERGSFVVFEGSLIKCDGSGEDERTQLVSVVFFGGLGKYVSSLPPVCVCKVVSPKKKKSESTERRRRFICRMDLFTLGGLGVGHTGRQIDT